MDTSTVGFGTMQLTGEGVWGPPASWTDAIQTLRCAYEWGVRLFDTAWYYGPQVTHRLLRESLHPYPDDLILVTKAGNARGPDRSWKPALSPEDLRQACDLDLRLLEVESLPLALLRWHPRQGDEARFTAAMHAMSDLAGAGKIRRIGVSNIEDRHLDIALAVTRVAAVSNAFSLSDQRDAPLMRRCASLGVPYLPYYPLLGGDIVRRPVVERIAGELGASAAQVALAWLCQQSDVVIPIPGTRSRRHLRENIDAYRLSLSPDQVARLSGHNT